MQLRQSKYILGGDQGAERGGVWGGGIPLPTKGGAWGGGIAPSPENFYDFGSQNGDLWCILGAIFGSSAKTLRGRKDTLAQIYFYWGGGNCPPRPPPGSTPLHLCLMLMMFAMFLSACGTLTDSSYCVKHDVNATQ